MKRRTKDAELILDIVRCAHIRGCSVAAEVADFLRVTSLRLRENRAYIRLNRYTRPAMCEAREKHCRRLLLLRRRLRKLVKIYASFRGEHPGAMLPPERTWP